MENNFEQLYHLVASLTQEEYDFIQSKDKQKNSVEKSKQYFLLHALLKNEIQSNPNVEIEGLKKKMEKELKNEIKDFRSAWRDTRNKILDFLDEFNQQPQNPKFQIRRLLDRCEYLIEKNLYELAQEAWQEAKELAFEHKFFDDYVRIFRLGMENQFKNDFKEISNLAKKFADIVFQISSTIKTHLDRNDIIKEIKNQHKQDYEKAIKSIQKTKKTTIQEEVLEVFGSVLQYHVKSQLEHKETQFGLAKQGDESFYQNWFYRLVFLFLGLNEQSEQYHFLTNDLVEYLRIAPQKLFTEHETKKLENTNIFEVSHNSWLMTWECLLYFEKFYFAFQQGYYERALLSLNQLKNTFQLNSHENSIKHTSLGYFLIRKIVSLELVTRLKSGENLENVKSITHALPQDLYIFSETQIEKTALRYEINLILLKFISYQSNSQTTERENLFEQINELLMDKKTLKDFTTYQADLYLMITFLEIQADTHENIESVIKKTKDFLTKTNLYKDFIQSYFEALQATQKKNQTITSIFTKEKIKELQEKAEKLNCFHVVFLKVLGG